MKTKFNQVAAAQIANDPVIDSSIQEAKWLLGSVASLAMIVFATGLAASIIGG